MVVVAECAVSLSSSAAGYPQGDPIGDCGVTPAGYAHMTALLGTLAHGKIVLVMEGGYSLTTLSRSWAACARVLRGSAPPPLTTRPRPDASTHEPSAE